MKAYEGKDMAELLDSLQKVLSEEERVIFAYLYGSAVLEENARDIDVAVYLRKGSPAHQVSADLKHALYKETGLSPDRFDIRVVNDLEVEGDLFALLYLKEVLEKGQILVDKSWEIRTDFLERYSFKYRECEGLIREVLA